MMLDVLVSIPVMLIVMMAIVNMYASTVTSQVRVQSRSRATIDAKNTMDRMTRELRQATALDAESSQRVDAKMPNGLWVRFDCSSGACLRLQGTWADDNAGGTYASTGPVLVDNVVNNGILSYTPDPVNPTYVSVTVQVRLKDKRGKYFGSPIVLSDGFNLRNMSSDS